MLIFSKRLGIALLLAIPAWSGLSAQQLDYADANIVVNGQRYPSGPEIKGIISARNGDRIRVTAADGTGTVIEVNDATRIRSGGSLFGGSLFGGNRGRLGPDALINGLPVTVKTFQTPGGLLAAQISFRSSDLKVARMIHGGTNQRFEEQTAATEALRGRMADIDQYNVKSTTNVYFDSGKWVLSAKAKTDLCAASSQADALNNALLLVVGYTDSRGSQEANQALSEKRAGGVINYLQQACHWKPYRMLTPTGMAESDPAASNDTEEGRAQNRRVSVNVLVSKAVDGM